MALVIVDEIKHIIRPIDVIHAIAFSYIQRHLESHGSRFAKVILKTHLKLSAVIMRSMKTVTKEGIENSKALRSPSSHARNISVVVDSSPGRRYVYILCLCDAQDHHD